MRNIYRLMIYRCTNPKSNHFHVYGGRGIKICDRWLASFEDFLADVGYRPSDDLTPAGGPIWSLDRIDNDGNYEPGNVRWATIEQQANNREFCNVITHEGRSQTMAQWAREFGMKNGTFTRRIRRGWTFEDARDTPVSGIFGRELAE